MLKLLLRKDFTELFRAKEVLLGTASFAVLLVVLSSFALRYVGISPREQEGITAGVLWMHLVFCGVLFLNQSFQSEIEEQGILGLLLDGVPPSFLYASKVIANFCFLSVLSAVLIALHAVLNGLDLFPKFFSLWLVLSGGLLGFVALGTLFSAISVATRTRDVVLPILLVPTLLPLSAAVTYVVRACLWNQSVGFDQFWVQLIIGFDAIALVLGWLLFDYVVRD